MQPAGRLFHITVLNGAVTETALQIFKRLQRMLEKFRIDTNFKFIIGSTMNIQLEYIL